MTKQHLNFSYDANNDLITIEGVTYTGDLFRLWARDLPLFQWHRIIRRENGVVTIETTKDEPGK